MRILAMTSLYPNPLQPQRAPFARHWLRILGESHSVRIIAPIAWTDELRARWRGAAAIPPERVSQQDGLHVEYPRYFFTPRLFRSLYGNFYRLSVERAFWRAATEFRPELIYSPWAFPDGWAASRLGHDASLPVVIQVHGSDLLLLDQFPGRRRKTHEALRAADGVVAVSTNIAEQLVRIGVRPERVRVIYDGVDRALFHPGSKKAAREKLGLVASEALLLFIGNLVPVKAVHVLLEACALLKSSGLGYQLCLIGQGPLRSTLEKQARRLGIAEQVRFLGSLPQQQLPDWYRASDVFVLPSLSEGVPNVLLEASACSTPFVASNVGGIAEIAHLGSSRLTPSGDAQALAEAITASLRSPAVQSQPAPRSRGDAVAELEEFLGGILAGARLNRLTSECLTARC